VDDFQRQQSNINFWQGEAFSKSNELINKTQDAHDARMGQIDAEKKAKAAIDEAKQYESETDYLLHLGTKLADKLETVQKQLEQSKEEIQLYKDLLSKPFAEIAAYHKGFNATYESQKELLAGWIVSQKAFRELSMNFGEEMGKTQEDITELAKISKLNVLENNTKYGNDAKDIEFVLPYVDSIKAKMQQ